MGKKQNEPIFKKTDIWIVSLIIILLIVLIILVSKGNIFFSPCIVGSIENGKYCDVDGTLKPLKNNGISCLNEFECKINSCVEGICQTKYSPFQQLVDDTSLLQDIWNKISGIQCQTGQDKCEGNDYFLCSSLLTWEAKGKVVGKCDWTADRCTSENSEKCEGEVSYKCEKNSNNQLIWVNKGRIDGKCGYSSGGGGGGCTPDWQCGPWSDTVKQCGTRTCKDLENCGRARDNSKYPIVKTCPTTPPPGSVCGNGECEWDESAEWCPEDCSDSYCGDGICSVDEDSITCPEDCIPPEPKDYRWLFWIVVIMLILAIIIVAYLLYRKVRDARRKTTFKSSMTSSSHVVNRPMPPVTPFVRFPPAQNTRAQPIYTPPKSDFPFIKEVVKEVPVEKEVIKEVPIEKKVYVDRPVYIQEKREPLNIPKYDYVGSSETKTYHKRSCRLGKLIKKKYKISNNSESYFRSRGFKRCAACFK